ncbi:MAG TPA: glycosyltransferase family 2 protein [Candidatus Limnocylindrales bacterium]|nr:glycosyltransferase family 2 protein [Candidatus Limnocylindrales bacterium]
MFTRGGRTAPSRRRALIILPLWGACLIWMWAWWLHAARINFLPLFIPLTLALLYEFAILPTVFLYFVFRAKLPPRRIAPKGKKVAVVSLCVPSKESMDIVERQLKAMSQITYPHDSWILDEGNNKTVKALAKKYGVKHFSRKGIKKYNQSTAPFAAKTKAGNVNAWLDQVKRYKYDYFVQLDIDHLAYSNYLHKTLGFFRDEKVAWVQAPSVYGNRDNWVARGSAEQELVLQGPLQMGFYGHSKTPFIIGSHCTYRMSAIREIGGFQPTRAEDHLDTVVLASKGYEGVFLPEIIAEGDGPETLSTYLAQQFAWAYSMFQVLLHHTPKLLKTMPIRKKIQFLFSQTWYPLWSLSYLVMFFCPLVALAINKEVARMNRPDFLAHFVPLFVCSFLVWWAARPFMQPRKLMLSWRGMILHAVRWPVILRAILNAAFGVKKSYMITPKGVFSQTAPALKTYKSFLLLGIVSAGTVLFATAMRGSAALESQIVFALTNACFMLVICFVDIDLRLRALKGKWYQVSADWFKPIAATTALAMVMGIAFVTTPFVTSRLAYARALPNTQTVPVKTVSLDEMTTQQLTDEIKHISGSTDMSVPELGMFTTDNKVRSSRRYIRHAFIDWRDSHELAKQLVISLRSGTVPLITLEPRGEPDGELLLDKITQGQYDSQLQEISKILSATKEPVYIRFAHEMELADLYPWGAKQPSSYITAYRYVVSYARSHQAENVKWVWSPAGNDGAEAYYPGDDMVDIVGTTILYDRYWYGDYQPSFHELAHERERLFLFNKPVWITEFGVGMYDERYQQSLINDAVNNFKNDGYSALVYLNIPDSNIVGPDYHLRNLSEFSDLFPDPTKAIIKPSDIQWGQFCAMTKTSENIYLANPSTVCADK